MSDGVLFNRESAKRIAATVRRDERRPQNPPVRTARRPIIRGGSNKVRRMQCIQNVQLILLGDGRTVPHVLAIQYEQTIGYLDASDIEQVFNGQHPWYNYVDGVSLGPKLVDLISLDDYVNPLFVGQHFTATKTHAVGGPANEMLSVNLQGSLTPLGEVAGNVVSSGRGILQSIGGTATQVIVSDIGQLTASTADGSLPAGSVAFVAWAGYYQTGLGNSTGATIGTPVYWLNNAACPEA